MRTSCAAFVLALLPWNPAPAAVEPQPFFAALKRLVDAADSLGSPFSAEEKTFFAEAMRRHDEAAVGETRKRLDAHTLFVVTITPEQRVKVAAGPATPELDEGGWRQYLVRVENEAGVTAKLRGLSPQAKEAYVPGSPPVAPNARPKDPGEPALEARWLDLALFEGQPMTPTLTGLAVEYRIVSLYSRDAGKREATFVFDVGQGTQDLGFRAEAAVLFDCRPANEIALSILDEKGEPCVAMLEIRDEAGRVYPSQTKRVAPDFFFHPQIYRADGESLRLPAGEYRVHFQRGPESLAEIREEVVTVGRNEWKFQVKRWVDPAARGWWSGDHHIHAAGCAHYSVPSQGVHAPDMARHCQGEDLKIGANLTWGPCFDYQKQFFTGKIDPASRYPFLLRYDVEVSGFGSHRSGHLCLLKLREQMYPGGNSTDHWPTLGLNTLRWAKKQGALCGPAHSGWGLAPIDPATPLGNPPQRSDRFPVATEALPNFIVPRFDGIGANEYIVDVTHEVEGPDGTPVPAIDFLSTVDTPAPWELNIWYHTLNAGFRTRISGETDFPCIYGERVGLGRAYVKLDGRVDYDEWCEGIRAGRAYVSDGRSHLMDFVLGGVAVGEKGSELTLAEAGEVDLAVSVAALLPETPDASLKGRPLSEKPFWHVERARLGTSRNVPVEVVFNGEPLAREVVPADGTTRDLKLRVAIPRSGWVALRIYPSSHTNPVFVTVAGEPVREKKSLEWCLAGVEQCWSQKKDFIAPAEMEDAIAAYEHAREVYRKRIAEASR